MKAYSSIIEYVFILFMNLVNCIKIFLSPYSKIEVFFYCVEYMYCIIYIRHSMDNVRIIDTITGKSNYFYTDNF